MSAGMRQRFIMDGAALKAHSEAEQLAMVTPASIAQTEGLTVGEFLSRRSAVMNMKKAQKKEQQRKSGGGL